MFTAFLTVFFTFIFSGVLASRFTHIWQRQSWLLQQRIVDRENEIKILRELVERFSTLAGKRQHKMLRLALALNSQDKSLIERRSVEYDEISEEWNSNIVSLYSNITMHVDFVYTKELESIQNKFVIVGNRISQTKNLTPGATKNKEISEIISALNRLQGSLGSLQKKLIRVIFEKKKEIYTEIEINENTLDRIPTWKLFKSLFDRRVKREEII
jgi:hypothetical protein